MDDRSLKVLMIRHSISLYNTLKEEKLAEHKVESEFLIAYIKFIKRPELLDCPLAPAGRALAAEAAAKNAKRLAGVKLVLCTAARRALQTAEILFAGRPEVVVVVLPFFERIESQGDIMSNTAQNMADFPQFDFGAVRRVLARRGWAWFIHELGDPVMRAELLAAVEDGARYGEEPEHIAKGYRMADYMRERMPALLEGFPQFLERMRRHKETVRRFLARPEWGHLQDGEVAIVAHHNFNRFFVAETFNADCFPEPCTEFANAEVKDYALSLFAEL